MNRARLMPMPWWWLMAPPRAMTLSMTASQAPRSTARPRRRRRRGSPDTGGAVGHAAGEGEVQAGAVDVGVGLVGRGRQGAVDGLEGGDTALVQPGAPSSGPRSRWCRRRSRPGTEGPGPRRRCGAPSTAPPAPRRASVAAAHSASTTAMVASSRPGSASSRTMRTQWSRHVEVAGGLGVVVEAQHGGRGAPAQDAPARLEPLGERRRSRRPAGSRPGRPGCSRSRAPVMTPRCLRSRRTSGSGRGPWPPAVRSRRCG